jgi:ACS family D-galactonate transporter-like MFS transporter
MGIMSIIRRVAWQRELAHYPPASARVWYLVLTLATAVALYSHIFVAVSVLPLLQRDLGFTQQQFGLFFMLVFLVSAVSSLFGSLSDRLGRANLVVYGSIVSALLTLGIALTGTTRSFFIAGWILTFVEGVLQVTLLALVRDFSPRMSRAFALGFYSIGPWGGQILATTVASLTLPIYGTWQSQYVISSTLSLLVALVAFLGLRELGPGLRGQVVVRADDATLEERAAHFDAAAATRHAWRQMLRSSIILSSLGYVLYGVPRYTFNVFLPTYLNGVLALSLAQANGIASFFGLAFIGGSLAVGFCSDRLQVRKPFMLIGTLAVALTLLFFMGLTPDTPLGVLTLTLICISFCQAMGNVSWQAAFTETAETINPALIGTALAIQGAILRLGSIGTAATQALVVGNGQGWATWWWVCIAALVIYLPSMLILTGGWSPARARAALAS